MEKLIAAPFFAVWYFAGPVTYIICVVDTWSSRMDVWLKLVMSLTLDAALAFLWPATWMFWGIRSLMGTETPLHHMFGW